MKPQTFFLTFVLLFAMAACNIAPEKRDWTTYYEKSGYKATPRYDETIAYCLQLAEASPMIHYETLGTSPQGRELPLLIIDKKHRFNPRAVRNAGNAVVLIQACIHAGEPDGKDAGLMLLRDMVIKKQYSNLLNHLTILFVPIFNVDGHEHFNAYNRINQDGPEEMGWRTTAQHYNLNRDFLKADAPEMQAWLKMFDKWLPDFFIDTHVTDGADYQYVLTYQMETLGTMDTALTRWQNQVYVPQMEAKMQEAGFPVFPYVSFRRWHDPRSGLVLRVAPPMISQGYSALQNRPGLLVETHMLKDYKSRVTATYELLRHSLSILNNQHRHLVKLNQQADSIVRTKAFRQQPLPVNYSISPNDSVMVDFLGFEYQGIPSDVTDGTWFQYSDTATTFNLPMFDLPVVEDSVFLPEAYIIPVEWTAVIDRLRYHSIQMRYLQQSDTLLVETYRFSNVKWRTTPYENHQMITHFDMETDTLPMPFAKGSAIVRTNQRTARIIAYLLEPRADGSLLKWGFFNPIFEQKEYGESYVIEGMARQMMAADTLLKQEFEAKKAAGEFHSYWQIINWFYSKTPYWDPRINLYPIGKIYDEQLLNEI